MNKEKSQAKPSILFLCQLPPPVHGSAVINQTIYESQLINTQFDTQFIDIKTARDIHDMGKHRLDKYWLSLKIFYQVWQTAVKKRFQLIYLTLAPHGFGFYKDALLALLLKSMGHKLVFHLHGKGIQQRIQKSKWRKRLYQWVFKDVQVIHLSPLLYFDIKELVPARNVNFVANALPIIPVRKARQQENIILYLSNMQESKGSMTLLKAARILKARGLDFKLFFVGKWHRDKTYQEHFKAYVQKHQLQEVVNYLGPKYGPEKEEVFLKASVFTLPTTNDCFPVSILEAMAYGLAVVSTREGAIPEIVDEGKNGFLIPKNNEEALADKLEKLLQDRNLCRTLGENARRKVQQCYNIESFENKLAAVFNELLEGEVLSESAY